MQYQLGDISKLLGNITQLLQPNKYFAQNLYIQKLCGISKSCKLRRTKTAKCTMRNPDSLLVVLYKPGKKNIVIGFWETGVHDQYDLYTSFRKWILGDGWNTLFILRITRNLNFEHCPHLLLKSNLTLIKEKTDQKITSKQSPTVISIIFANANTVDRRL